MKIMTIYLLIIASITVLGCQNRTKDKVIAKTAEVATDTIDYKLEVYDYIGLKPLLNLKDDKTYVINFWATWCAPCIKEMPYFEKLNKSYKDKLVEVVFVSLDFPNQYESRLKPFLKKNNIQSRVVALDDTDQNTWIPGISESWTGAIPATLIYNANKRNFYERTFTYEALENELKQFLK